MGKETREKTRHQRNSAPYNASNSSFARRFTSKLGEYIPSNWASGWFDNNTKDEEDGTSTENPNAIQVAVEINHFENVSTSPKRSSLPNHNKLASNSNNRTTYTSKSNALGNETCSPILYSDRKTRDLQLPGPSGHGQSNKPTHNLFVASTPAFNVNRPHGENGSESGESTSGCSSLVSQSNKLRTGTDMGKSKSLFPNRQIPTEDITKNNHKSSGPQFDTSLFNSSSPSFNKSVNLSPFYPGRTMYGGASTYRKYSIGSNKSTTSPTIFQPSLRRASVCNQSKVNPSPTTLPKMSVVAENILKTINAMTPVTRLMTMPTPEEVNNSPASLRGTGIGNGVKRKLKELQIPTVVNTNLIHLKGSERKNALSQSIQEALSSCSSSSDEDLDYAIVSNDAKRSLKEKMKRLRRGKNRNEEVQTEVNLPNAVLDVPSLPVIDIPLVKPSLDVSFSDPIECQNFNISSESSLLSVSSNQDSDVNVKSNSVNFVYNSEPSKPKPRRSITLSPPEASPQPNILTPIKEPPKLGKTWDCDICLNKFNPSESVCKACGMPQNTNNKLDSITEVTKPSSSLIEKFKPSSDTWECDACCVRNKADVVACVCCTTPKPGAKSSTPAPAPISTTTTTSSSGGFGDLFKKPSGNWECPACMISNKSTDEKCVACETTKPGTKPAATPASNVMTGPKFPFATSLDTATSFKFGVDKVDAKSPVPEEAKPAVSTSVAVAPVFSFGMPSASTAQSTTLPVFSFGMPKAQDTSTEKKETSVALTSASNSTINSTINSTVIASTSNPTLSTASSFMFKSNSSQSTSTDIKPPAVSLPSTVVTSALEVKVNPISTPSLIFGSTNGPISKPETIVLSPKPVEVKPDVKESPTPKMSLFGATPSFLTNNTTDAQKPLGSLFGQATAVNNLESNKALNSFDAKKVQFNLAPTSNGEPPNKMVDFGKPSTASEPPKASIFGAAVFDKPKENSIFASSNSNVAPPPAFPTKPESNVFTFGSTSKPVNNAFSAATPSTGPVFAFGSSASTPQQPQAPTNAQSTLNFASPTPAPAFSFNATATNSNFNSVPQSAPPAQQPVSLFGGGSNVFGNSAPPAAAAAPMFSAGFNQPPSATPSPAPFTFGAPAPSNNASAGFSFGAQNAAPASNAGFSFGAPFPPAFDPKMRPSFNFTSGAAPTFSAQPGLTASSSIGARRIKKAVRRK